MNPPLLYLDHPTDVVLWTLAKEVLVPLYCLGVLIFLKMLVPNPNFPEVSKPGRLLRIHHDILPENHSVAVVADWATANGTVVRLPLTAALEVI
ncbi:hypothetical protein RR48_01106 [Papilio machaon]|uniref:Uncharacterized protein n=1 Tax=Papilio machaon TaxID=76193 RepID=A0A0N0PDL2_PAPMA|nr:hypothetical protein RR48_01106 [Papilio machaon]